MEAVYAQCTGPDPALVFGSDGTWGVSMGWEAAWRRVGPRWWVPSWRWEAPWGEPWAGHVGHARVPWWEALPGRDPTYWRRHAPAHQQPIDQHAQRQGMGFSLLLMLSPTAAAHHPMSLFLWLSQPSCPQAGVTLPGYGTQPHEATHASSLHPAASCCKAALPASSPRRLPSHPTAAAACSSGALVPDPLLPLSTQAQDEESACIGQCDCGHSPRTQQDLRGHTLLWEAQRWAEDTTTAEGPAQVHPRAGAWGLGAHLHKHQVCGSLALLSVTQVRALVLARWLGQGTVSECPRGSY